VMRLGKYPDRIVVGSERMLNCTNECPECGMEKGQMHTLGCAHEECPLCRKFLIGCHCNCLSPGDSEKIIKSLHRQFTDLVDAALVVTAAGIEPGGRPSYLIHAAMQFLYENVSETTREELNRGFQECHPGLVPQLQDESGYGYYTAEQLSQALQIPLSAVHEKIDAMVAAGQGLRFGNGIQLQKVN
jgi:hypothetical protein